MNVVIIGASGGIGRAIVESLSKNNSTKKIYAFSRSEYDFQDLKVHSAPIDMTNEESIKAAAEQCSGHIDLIICATGMLHDDSSLPEKSLRDLNMNAMQKIFAINTIGPALVIKYFAPLLPKDKSSVLACLSARVGSISDNRIGGWYSYRASKAALNMVIKNAAIETARRYKHAIIVGLHPGTVDTDLSKPFQNNVQHEIFTPDTSAHYLLNVINHLKSQDSGKCFAWDGQEVDP